MGVHQSNTIIAIIPINALFLTAITLLSLFLEASTMSASGCGGVVLMVELLIPSRLSPVRGLGLRGPNSDNPSALGVDLANSLSDAWTCA